MLCRRHCPKCFFFPLLFYHPGSICPSFFLVLLRFFLVLLPRFNPINRQNDCDSNSSSNKFGDQHYALRQEYDPNHDDAHQSSYCSPDMENNQRSEGKNKTDDDLSFLASLPCARLSLASW